MNEDEIKDMIKQGEGVSLEFKQSFPQNNNDLAKEMVAFANSRGGILLMGVSDDREILGVDTAAIDETKRKLASFARDICKPPINPDIGHSFVDEKPVVWMKIQQETIPRSSGDKYYIRIGSIVKIAYIDELIEILQKDSVFQKVALGSITLVIEDVLSCTKEILEENQNVMASALYEGLYRNQLARDVYSIFHRQQRRADYSEWAAFLKTKLESIQGETNKSIVSKVIASIERLQETLYSTKSDLKLASKLGVARVLKDGKAEDKEVLQIIEDYLEQLRKSLDEISSALGELKATMQ